MLSFRILLAPALSYVALITLSFAKIHGMPILPLSGQLEVFWLAASAVMMVIIILQNPAIRAQSRGVWYMTIGGVTGMVLGLLGFTITPSLNANYAIMLLTTATGVCFGMLLFGKTPAGAAVAPGSGHFFRYLLAKGFPILITVAQLGVAAVILCASVG